MTDQGPGMTAEPTEAKREQPACPAVTWRALAISVAVAVVLAVAATLLLQGAIRHGRAGGTGTRTPGECCQPRGNK